MGRLGIEDHFPEKNRTEADVTTNVVKKIRHLFVGDMGDTITIPAIIHGCRIPTVTLFPAIAQLVKEGVISGPHAAREGDEYWLGRFMVQMRDGEAVHHYDPRLHGPKRIPWEVYWSGRNCFRWNHKKDLKAMQKAATERYKREVGAVDWDKRYYELHIQSKDPVRWQCHHCTNMNLVPELVDGVEYKCKTGCGKMQVHSSNNCPRCGMRGKPHRRHFPEERTECNVHIMENVHKL